MTRCAFEQYLGKQNLIWRRKSTSNMRREIAAVVWFVKRHLTGEKVDLQKVELLAERLAHALQEKFKGHWYPENPSRGQAYRCIRINMFCQHDPELLQACKESGFQYSHLGLPQELTLWVDPGEVCCRYREHTPCFTVATFSRDEEEEGHGGAEVAGALESETSDYQSCSSSDEERVHTSPPSPNTNHGAGQALNPDAPTWYPNSTVPQLAHIPQLAPPGFRPCRSSLQAFRNKMWVPPQEKLLDTGPPKTLWHTVPMRNHFAYC